MRPVISPTRTHSRIQQRNCGEDAPLPVGDLRAQLLRWYRRNRRELPWRQDSDPYRVWLSEIMLQQTRVAAVLTHYQEFLRRFSSVEKLAKASPAAVLAAWSGLGYYRRARSLQQAACQIVRQGGGRFPATAEQWRQLPGIGRYTAAAIASIAFGERCAVVDGNVTRVLERLLGKQPQDCWQLAQKLLSRAHPGDFNQAMMELGATVCLPARPRCDACPLARWCQACSRPRAQGVLKGAERLRREVAYALLLDPDRVYLVQRPADAALMPGMWELPGLPFRGPAQLSRKERTECVLHLRHAITNTDYRVTIVRGTVADALNIAAVSRRRDRGAAGRWVSPVRAAQLPLTGLARKVLRRFAII